MHPMSGKLDRARPIFVCWSELFYFYSIGNLLEYACTPPGGFAAAECAAPSSADADMEKLHDTLINMYVTDYN